MRACAGFFHLWVIRSINDRWRVCFAWRGHHAYDVEIVSRSAHWAFDRGIFTISDQYEVVVNPKARAADAAKFPILELDHNGIMLPSDKAYWPHQEALEWHKKEIVERFSL